MNIVIAGAGEVGTHLAKMLSQEEQNIVLIDPNPKRLELAAMRSELLPQVGNPLSPSDLLQANVKYADLFISVMPEEADNILACALASRLGAGKTLARINNNEFLKPDMAQYFRDMGVHTMIYPELLAAREIVSTIKNPWARQYVELFDGALVLVGVKVREGAHIVGKYLHELTRTGNKIFHIVAIKRDLETIIPKGGTQVLHGDIVFFATAQNHLDEVRKLAGKDNPPIHKVVIMGGSRIAIRSIEMIPRNIQVAIIEKDKEKSMRISAIAPTNVQVYNGDGRDSDILIEAGLDQTDVFIALTENSETNVLACLGAKRFGVFKTIAKEENIDYISLADRLDIGTLINKKLLAAGSIYRIFLGEDTSTVKCLTLANADVAELVAHRGAPVTKRPVKDLNIPEGITFGGMVRNGVPQMIHGDTVIEPYDHVVVFCLNTPLNILKDFFG